MQVASAVEVVSSPAVLLVEFFQPVPAAELALQVPLVLKELQVVPQAPLVSLEALLQCEASPSPYPSHLPSEPHPVEELLSLPSRREDLTSHQCHPALQRPVVQLAVLVF